MIEDVIERMSKSSSAENARFVSQPVIHELDDLLEEIANLDIMVATRYHGIVLSLLLQVPVFAVAYHRKSLDIMHWLNLEDYAIDAECFEVDELTEKFSLLKKNRKSIEESLRRKVPEFRASVRAQYDEVFRIVEELT